MKGAETPIPRTPDFHLTGAGDEGEWGRADWLDLRRIGAGRSQYRTRAKGLWSDTGIYFLFDCEDRVLRCAMQNDFEDLYREDVVEVFLWPLEAQHTYFEYELSPLNFELPILVSNHEGRFHGWLPWHYSGSRRCRHATSVAGGEKAPGAPVSGWQAELFIPFDLLAGLGRCPPKAGPLSGQPTGPCWVSWWRSAASCGTPGCHGRTGSGCGPRKSGWPDRSGSATCSSPSGSASPR